MFITDYAVPGVTVPSIKKGLGFVVLCLDDLPSEVRLTLAGIKNLFEDAPIRLVMPTRLACDERDRYKSFGVPIDMGDKTITGMINTGVYNSKSDWNLVVMAGAKVTQNLVKKYLYFCRRDKDFVYPVVERRWAFSEASINGLMFNRDCCPAAPEGEPDIMVAKTLWGADIVQKGGQMKAIIGANF